MSGKYLHEEEDYRWSHGQNLRCEAAREILGVFVFSAGEKAMKRQVSNETARLVARYIWHGTSQSDCYSLRNLCAYIR